MAKKNKDQDKDKGKKKGFLGRIFGGKEGEAGDPATPAGDMDPIDAPTICPDDREDDGPEANTIPPGSLVAPQAGAKGGKAPPKAAPPKGAAPKTPPAKATPAGGDDDEGDQRTIPPFDRPDLAPPPSDPFADEADQRTIPPFDRPDLAPPAEKPGKKNWGKAGRAPAEKSAAAPDPFADEADQRTIPPFDRPAMATPRGATTPSDDFSAEGLTLAPGTNLDDFLDPGATIPPTHLMQSPVGPPGKKAGARAEQDLLVTADPDLAAVPRAPSDDPFAFPPGDDLMAAPPSGAPPPPSADADPWGFGDDVVDLLAPDPGAAAPPPPVPARGGARPQPQPALPADDPFGAALTDDPFDFAGAQPAPGQSRQKTEELVAVSAGKTDEIELFDLELGAEGARHGAPARAEVLQDEQTLEMERPSGSAVRRTGEAARVAPALPRQTLFASIVAKPDGTRRLGAPAPQVVIDHERSLLFAPPVPGGWAEVPAFAVLLGDGSVVGRLPRGTRREPDGSMVVPAPAPRREGTLPAGVSVDRVANVAHASPELADQLQGGPGTVIRTDEGGVLLLLPAGTKWNDNGTYMLPPEPPKLVAPGSGASSTGGEALAPAHAAHGAAVLRSAYLGCEEIVYEDGWATIKLPEGARLDGDVVVFPASSRDARGERPAHLEVETRLDGTLAVRLPAGWSPQGDLAWVPPAPATSEVDSDHAEDPGFGEPVETLTYLGIEDSLHANGWTRLDLPPGATVVRGRLRLPKEYAHAGDARQRAQFDREADGTLVCDLPPEAEVQGSVVLIPPGRDSAARDSSARDGAARDGAAAPTLAAKENDWTSSKDSSSALPPGGLSRDPGVKPKGIASFRSKKNQDEAPGAPEPEKPAETAAETPEAAEVPAATAPAGDKPAASGEGEVEDDGPDEDPGAASAPEGTIKRGRGKRKKS